MHGRTLRVTYLLLVLFLAAILYYYYDTNIAPPEDAILKTDQVQNLAQTRDEVITEAKKKNVRNITVEEPEKDNQDAQNGKGSKPPVEQTLENHDQKALVAGEQTREDRHAVNPEKNNNDRKSVFSDQPSAKVSSGANNQEIPQTAANSNLTSGDKSASAVFEKPVVLSSPSIPRIEIINKEQGKNVANDPAQDARSAEHEGAKGRFVENQLQAALPNVISPSTNQKVIDKLKNNSSSDLEATSSLEKKSSITVRNLVGDGAGPVTIDIVRVGKDGSLIIAGKSWDLARMFLSINGSDPEEIIANDDGAFLYQNQLLLSDGPFLITLADETGGRAEIFIKTGINGDSVERVIANDQDGTQTIKGMKNVSELEVHALALSDDAIELLGSGGGDVVISLNGNPTEVIISRSPEGDWRAKLRASELSNGQHQLEINCSEPCAGMKTIGFEIGNEEQGTYLLVVQAGNSLWRLARRFYGQGIFYTLIFDANRDRINDPNLIFPGQKFSVPNR
ncbi:MAG: LysM peptidoglycan-binding domain-containing protein [Alphaproteobacteria bacterium]|nr:LysM peptidoglycan-binding domain-containing protein [Alphaproteobacteria bacterium]